MVLAHGDGKLFEIVFLLCSGCRRLFLERERRDSYYRNVLLARLSCLLISQCTCYTHTYMANTLYSPAGLIAVFPLILAQNLSTFQFKWKRTVSNCVITKNTVCVCVCVCVCESWMHSLMSGCLFL